MCILVTIIFFTIIFFIYLTDFYCIWFRSAAGVSHRSTTGLLGAAIATGRPDAAGSESAAGQHIFHRILAVM